MCFEPQLGGEWFRIARTVREMGNRHVEQGGGRALWGFLDFVAMHRGALYALLLPFMHTRLQVREQPIVKIVMLYPSYNSDLTVFNN